MCVLFPSNNQPTENWLTLIKNVFIYYLFIYYVFIYYLY